MPITYGSVCSGVEAASLAWEPLGLKPAWFSEFMPFPSAVLAHHWPKVANIGDMLNIREYLRLGGIPKPDILVGGTPCQAFSVAGLRNSLGDSRGQLTLEFIRIANELKDDAVIVWENVPGVLSSKDNAFGCLLAGLAGEDAPLEPPGAKWSNAGIVCGPKRTVAWRVLDAQFFGLAQRRKRVFVVASAKEGFDPGQVLFEFKGVRRDSPPIRETGQTSTGGSSSGATADDRPVGTLDKECGYQSQAFQSVKAGHVVRAFASSSFAQYTEGPGVLRASGGDLGGGSETLVAGTITARMFQALGARDVEEGALTVCKQGEDVAFHQNTRNELRETPIFGALSKGGGKPRQGYPALRTKAGFVRKLMPVEAERLQGMPDNHTRVPYRGKPAEDCPDGPRYEAIGNSMAVAVMRWLGERIVDNLENKL
jgi:DNA (cytosine-5)-methyltransferase 1